MKPKLLFVLILINVVAAADRFLFKTCEQSSFCRRCRHVSGASSYEVIPGSLSSGPSSLSVDIRNNENQQLFVLQLEALKDNIFRFEMDEKTPLRKRYRVMEVLDDHPGNDPITVTTSTEQIVVSSLLNKAVIKLKPFQAEFYHDEVLSLTVNGKALLRFEHLRTKPVSLGPDEDPDSWEETFMDVTDTKPNGPEAVAVDFTFPHSEVLFGIPEHADDFALKPTVGDEPYRLYTLDVTFYELDSRMPIYGAVPVIYGHGNNRTTGVFWHNSADTFVDIHDMKTAHFISEAGIIDVYVLLGPKPNEAFSQYTKITGTANLPQLFSLAFHQSRWNYMTQAETLEVVAKFDENNIPLDTIWLDIEYTDGKRYFTWNYETFPDPLDMMRQLELSGRHLTYIVDPHVKIDGDYFFYRENRDRGFFIKDKDGNDFEGSCWPGNSSYVDYFNPDALRYYADQFLLSNFPHNSIETGLWNDMNEPTVFDVPEKTMFKDNIHHGGFEHRNVHSLYAHMQVKGTFDGLMRRGNGRLRPFILTRAFFSGTQRFSAVWTGDNGAEWGYLQASVKICLSLSVAGHSFCGSDIGGFFGDPEEELFIRWYQAAAFQPFFRSHASVDTKHREPYEPNWPQQTMYVIRDAIRKRYALLPFWYTMFYEHERDGKPVMRPMFSEFPLDKNTFKLDQQYMLSDKLLIRPVLEKGADHVDVYFPASNAEGTEGDRWYDFYYHDQIGELEEHKSFGARAFDVGVSNVPVFQRGGTIVPKKEELRRASALMRDDPITLVVALDSYMRATGTLYIDDERSYDYRSGEYLYLQFAYNDKTLTSRFIDSGANYTTNSRLNKVIVSGRDWIPLYATLTTTDGTSKRLNIFANHDDKYFVVEDIDASLMDEWEIVMMSGAMKKAVCAALLVLVSIFHAFRFL